MKGVIFITPTLTNAMTRLIFSIQKNQDLLNKHLVDLGQVGKDLTSCVEDPSHLTISRKIKNVSEVYKKKIERINHLKKNCEDINKNLEINLQTIYSHFDDVFDIDSDPHSFEIIVPRLTAPLME